MTRPKLLILGHARHGKDTVAEILRDNHGLSFASSSLFLAERIMLPYFESIGEPYASLEECYADRGNHRATWHNQIAAYNTPDKARLPREILEVADAYVGMRSDAEFAASRELFDHVVWVDASGRGLSPEDRSSFNITQTPDMYLIENNGTLEDLEGAVAEFAQSIGLGDN
jgi:hypothetical protein